MQTAIDRERIFKATRKAVAVEMRKRGYEPTYSFRGLVFESVSHKLVTLTYTWVPTTDDHMLLQADINGISVKPDDTATHLEFFVQE